MLRAGSVIAPSGTGDQRSSTTMTAPMPRDPIQTHPTTVPLHSPELLYLLHGDPAELAEALATMRSADIADALRDLRPDAAAKVMAALPFDLAVQVFDEPDLEHFR